MSIKTWRPQTIGAVRDVVQIAIFETSDTLRNALQFAEQFDAAEGIENGVYARKIRAELTRRGESY